MTIIDLSLPIYTGMDVYPGDPEANIELIQTFEKDEWNMRRIQMNSHDGTHVNVPIHGALIGKNLDDYKLDDFVGKARKYKNLSDIQAGVGVIFTDINIDRKITDEIIKKRPKFVGLSDQFEFDIQLEKELLAADVISFERLANTDQLPEEFFFHGAPLKIQAGDGSPVRAYAICD